MVFQKKSTTTIITGIDVGSTATRVAVGQCTHVGNGKAEVQIIATVEAPSQGVHKGVVTSIEETVSSISHALEETERLIGVPVEHAWVGVSGSHIHMQDSKGVVAVAKADGEISEEDISRALSAAKTVAAPLNYEIIHVLPKRYAVDGQTGIKDPVGMTGIRLEVDVQIIHGMTAHLKNLTKAVYRTGIDIDDLVLSILAAGDVVTTSRQKELGVAVVNIGGSTTSVVVYEEGDIIHTAVLPIGSEHITNDLAIGLRTSIDVADQVKMMWGDCISKSYTKKDVVDLFDAGAEYHEEVLRSFIADIAGARVAEILEKVDQELLKVHRNGLLPAGILFTGGGSKIHGIVELAKHEMRLPSALGYPMNITSIADRANDVSFSTAIGLVRWASAFEGQVVRHQSLMRSGGKVFGKMREFFQSLIP